MKLRIGGRRQRLTARIRIPGLKLSINPETGAWSWRPSRFVSLSGRPDRSSGRRRR